MLDRARCGAAILALSIAIAAAPGTSRGDAERQGEAFTYRLSLGPIEGGRARLAIAPPRLQGNEGGHGEHIGHGASGQHRVIHVVAQAEAVGLAQMLLQLRDEYRLRLDADTLLPEQVDIVETGTLRSRRVNGKLSGRRVDIRYTQSANGPELRLLGDLPSEPRDPVTAFLGLRASALRDGDHLEMVVLDGAAFYQGRVEVVGREPMQTQDGPRTAIRLRCQGERMNEHGQALRPKRVREATLWLSDDRYRVPLRIEGETDLGKASFDLTSYEPPRRAFVRPTSLPGLTTRKTPGPGDKPQGRRTDGFGHRAAARYML